MKILKRYELPRISIQLVRGDLFQDHSLNAILLGTQMFRKNANKWLEFKSATMHFPALQMTFFCFYKNKCVSRETIGDWLLRDQAHFLEIATRPVHFGDVFVMSGMASDFLLEPYMLTANNRCIVLVPEDFCGSGPRNEVKDSFLQFMKFASKNSLSPIGCVSFGYNWRETDAVLGICDAVRCFSPSIKLEVHIFEYNKKKEPQNLEIIEAELRNMEERNES